MSDRSEEKKARKAQFEKANSRSTRERTIQSAIDHYQSLRLPPESPIKEPEWIPAPFGEISKFRQEAIENFISDKIHNGQDATLGNKRIFQGLYIIGCTSWVFMGRKQAVAEGRYKILQLPGGVIYATARLVPNVQQTTQIEYGGLYADIIKAGGKVIGNAAVADVPPNEYLWAVWTPKSPFSLYDRNPGSEKDVDELFANPERYGLSQYV